MRTLFTARSGASELKLLQEYLPSQEILAGLSGLQQQAAIVRRIKATIDKFTPFTQYNKYSLRV